MNGAPKGQDRFVSHLSIEGMTCAACVRRVEGALERVPGVRDARVNLMLGRASITASARIAGADLVRAVETAGYRGRVETSALAKVNPSDVPWWLLIGTWLLTLPFLAGMLGMAFGRAWMPDGWVQFGLALPIQVIAGYGFYVRALDGLRHGTATMDVLVVLGSTAAFGFSLWSLIAHGGHAHLYFEAAAVVIAMVLLGRWLEARQRSRATEAIRGLMILQPEMVLRETLAGPESVAPEALSIGDIVLFRPGERAAADGIVVSGESEVDESLLTGEPLPKVKRAGDPVAAGALNGLALLRLRVEAAGPSSTLGRMIRAVQEAQMRKGRIIRKVDRVSAVFVPVVIVLALVTLAGWLAAGAEAGRALENAIAVLVIACPCALGLATPAALAAGTGAAARAGILFRDLDAIEAAGRIDTLYFDKTGTLSESAPRLMAVEAVAGDDRGLLQRAASLQIASTHPIATAMRASAQAYGLALTAPSSIEVAAGQGVWGVVQGQPLLLGNQSFMQARGISIAALAPCTEGWKARGYSTVFAASERMLLGAFAFDHPLRAEAAEALDMLRSRRIALGLLSGDTDGNAQAAAEALNIPQAHGGLAPADKVAFLHAAKAQGRHVAFVGDGLNDAAALAEADLGIAIGGGADAAADAAAITLMRADLRLVPAALDIARKTRAKVWQNLFFAFVYNAAGLPLAALGLLSPAVAGAAMALSSVSVVANAAALSQWRPRQAQSPAWPKRLGGALRWLFLIGAGLPLVWVMLYALAPVPATPMMLASALGGGGLARDWTSLAQISPHLVRAVIASEDQSFCAHYGFDFDEIGRAIARSERGGRLRGASTISQQTARNTFLWTGRSYLRKGLEAYFTLLIEAGWSKRRILEVYLNVVEWGPGVFGAESAAQHWFKKPAARLTAVEAARLAAILPNPHKFRANPADGRTAARTLRILARMRPVRVQNLDGCVTGIASIGTATRKSP